MFLFEVYVISFQALEVKYMKARNKMDDGGEKLLSNKTVLIVLIYHVVTTVLYSDYKKVLVYFNNTVMN
jgi:hypothetical protein